MSEEKQERARIEIDEENAKNIRKLQESIRMLKTQLDSIITTLVNVHKVPKDEKWDILPDGSAFIKVAAPEVVKPKGLIKPPENEGDENENVQ
jgi:hypothetical protein